MTSESGEQRKVRDIVRVVIADVAPDELPLVDALRQLDDATAVRRLNQSNRRREPLGFGLETLAVLLTPIVWKVLDRLANRLLDRTVERAVDYSLLRLRRLFRRPKTEQRLPALSDEQIDGVCAQIRKMADEAGADDDDATRLVDRVRKALHTPHSQSTESATDQRPDARPVTGGPPTASD